MAAEDGADGLPPWMVVGLSLDIRRKPGAAEPGEEPDVTDLHEEGCGELTRTELLESYSRHLLTWIHTWQTEGFGPIHEMLLFRAEGYREPIRLEFAGAVHEGRFAGLDDHGNLLLETGGETRLLDIGAVIETLDTVGRDS
jgi:biotin-(acetyl-CoA carboxylase) ligase